MDARSKFKDTDKLSRITSAIYQNVYSEEENKADETFEDGKMHRKIQLSEFQNLEILRCVNRLRIRWIETRIVSAIRFLLEEETIVKTILWDYKTAF